MPGFVTHHIMGVNAFKQLEDTGIKNIIKKYRHSYLTGLQGPDVFFYYPPASYGHGINIGNSLHKKDTGSFFKNLIKAVETVRNEHDFEICTAYILGYMGHYIADTALHPYVYSRVGTAADSRVLGIHFGLETDIDRCVLKHYKNMTPDRFDHKKAAMLSSDEQNVIAMLLHKAILSTYNAEISTISIKAAMLSFRLESSLVMDKKGYKHNILNFIERHTVGYAVFSPLLVNDAEHMDDPCNADHALWCNPWDSATPSSESVYGLIDDAVCRHTVLMNCMYEALDKSYRYNDTSGSAILEKLGNLSMTSGLDCSIELKR